MTIFTHSLSNGLRVAVEETPNFKTASIGVWINVGTRFESKAENGIAHFLEHMAFKGTHSRTSLEIAKDIENIGGYVNAYTSREVTSYSAKVLSEHFAIGLDILSDIVQNSIFNEIEIELERQVILQELGMYLDTPEDVVFDWLQDACYPDQALGRNILGTRENIKKFNRKDFIKFLKKFYAPNQIILCVAGNVDSKEVFQLSEEKFGGLEKFEIDKPAPAKFIGGEYIKIKKLEQIHFGLAFEAPKFGDKDLYDASIFVSILGGGMSSRLFQEIREKRGLCYSVFSFMENFLDTGTITIYAGTSDQKVCELADVVTQEINKLGHLVTPEELERAKAQTKASIVMGLESLTNRCERMARALTVLGHIPSIDEIIRKVEEVSVSGVTDFGSKLLHSNKASLSIYGPIKESPKVSQILSGLSY